MFGKDRAVDVPFDVEAPVTAGVAGFEDGPIALDLGAVRDEPVSKGWHPVRIERADPGRSKQKQLLQIFVLARVMDEASPEFNRTIIWNSMMEGDGLIFTKRCFRALGLPEALNYPSLQALADDLIDREVEVQVKHRVYEGQQQTNVVNWRPLTPEISF